ncbi:MAG: class I SAM-dependent methyltransferase [Sciscionella sp.]
MSPAADDVPYRLDDWSGELDPRAATELFSELARWLGSSGTVLDVGTGSGYVATALIAHGVPVVAVDIVDWQASDVALPFALADACALPAAAGSCSGVHMARMLAHVADWRLALAEMVRVLRQDGALCLSLGGWFADGPLREVERAVRAEALRCGVHPARAHADLGGPSDVDAELARLGLGAPEQVEVSGILLRSPRQVVADVVGRTDRWERGQDLSLLYDIGGTVLTALPMNIDEPLPQQENISYRVYRKG